MDPAVSSAGARDRVASEGAPSPADWLLHPMLLERTLNDILRQLDRGSRIEEAPELARLVHWRGDRDLPLHRWFRYREGYSPALIDALHLGDRVLDPFCGCGSIMVGCAQRARTSLGIDVNPLAGFVARVKLTPLEVEELADVRRFLRRLREVVADVEPAPSPALRIVDKLFEPDILDHVLRLRAAIDVGDHSGRVRDFLHLAFVAVLQDVGSFFKEGNGLKYRNRKRVRDRYVQRPEGDWQLKRFGSDQRRFVLATYSRHLSDMLDDTGMWAGMTCDAQTIIEASALDLPEAAADRQFDSIVFSPPYANRFDYFESMKVELWFGGFVSSYEDMRALRKRSMRSHLGADLTQPAEMLPDLEALIDMMSRDASSWRMGVPGALRGYFDDVRQVLGGCRDVLVEGGGCHVVVGNSAYAGVIVPTDALVAQIGIQAGFDQATIRPVRHLTVAPQQRATLKGAEGYMRESVVSFR
jgi:site-specific DNA-methyltransferase (adenine-specific)